jgi:hypothetical protein
MSEAITLRDTIVGDPDMQPLNATDWWRQGFRTGYKSADVSPADR